MRSPAFVVLIISYLRDRKMYIPSLRGVHPAATKPGPVATESGPAAAKPVGAGRGSRLVYIEPRSIFNNS